MSGMGACVSKEKVRIDTRCEWFKFHHCLATMAENHSKLVKFCDQDADYCAKKSGKKVFHVEHS